MKTWRKEILDKGFIELIDQMGDQWSITQAARTSYKGENKGEEQDGKLLRYLVKNHHDGPLEFVQFKFRVSCPLMIARQWMRSRTMSYNEWSSRYTEIPTVFYTPDDWRTKHPTNKQSSTAIEDDELNQAFTDKYMEFLDVVEDTYKYFLDNGMAKELARMVLPTSIYTQFVFSVNLRNLLHFIDLRAEEHAQWEIQQYGYALKEFVKEEFPIVYGAWEQRKEK